MAAPVPAPRTAPMAAPRPPPSAPPTMAPAAPPKRAPPRVSWAAASCAGIARASPSRAAIPTFRIIPKSSSDDRPVTLVGIGVGTVNDMARHCGQTGAAAGGEEEPQQLVTELVVQRGRG